MPTLDVLSTRRPYRALVVDDEASICALLVALLTHAGWDVVLATRCSEARTVLEDRTQPLDLFIVDRKLPDGDGMDLIPEARERRQVPDIVVMTGFADEDAYKRAIRAGVLDFLEKPFSAAEVGNMLRARTLRERERLGIVSDRFDRVDRDFADVRAELQGIRATLQSWEAGGGPARAMGRG